MDGFKAALEFGVLFFEFLEALGKLGALLLVGLGLLLGVGFGQRQALLEGFELLVGRARGGAQVFLQGIGVDAA